MQRQKDSVNLMTFIKPHQSGFLLSIILAVISVTSGIVPYFAVARIVNLLIGGETNFSAYLTWGNCCPYSLSDEVCFSWALYQMFPRSDIPCAFRNTTGDCG